MNQFVPIVLLFYVGLSMYCYVSILPFLATVFTTTDFIMNITIISYMFFYGIFKSFWLFLSSAISDKVILIISILLSLIGISITILSHHLSFFIIGRAAEAIGLCGSLTIVRAHVHQNFEATDYSKFIANVSIYIFIACFIGPIAGYLIFTSLGWRYIFGLLLLLNLVANTYVALVYIGERTEYLIKTHIKKSVTIFFSLLINRKSMSYLLPSVLTLSGCYAYFIATFNIFMRILGYTIDQMVILNIPIVVAFILGDIVESFLSMKLSSYKIVVVATIVLLASAIAFGSFYKFASFSPLSVIVPFTLLFFASGILCPCCFSKAKLLHSKFQVELSALFPFLIFLSSSIFSFIASLLNLYTTIELNTAYIILIVLSIFSFFILARPDNKVISS